MKNSILYLFLFFLTTTCSAPSDISWPEAKPQACPGARWWWLGSAVDSAGLTANMEDLYHAGFGAVEITSVPSGLTGTVTITPLTKL